MSPFKILLLVVLIAALWYGFRIVSRVRALRRILQEQAEAVRAASARSAGGGQIEELVKCSECGEYVSEKATSCGRSGCPFRG